MRLDTGTESLLLLLGVELWTEIAFRGFFSKETGEPVIACVGILQMNLLTPIHFPVLIRMLSNLSSGLRYGVLFGSAKAGASPRNNGGVREAHLTHL